MRSQNCELQFCLDISRLQLRSPAEYVIRVIWANVWTCCFDRFSWIQNFLNLSGIKDPLFVPDEFFYKLQSNK